MARQNEYGQPIGDPLAGDFPRPRPPHKSMVGRYCTLEPVSTQHAEALFDAFSGATDSRNWTYLPMEPFESVAECQAWLSAAMQSEDPQYFTVLDANGTAVGWASYLRIDPDAGAIEVGWINFSPRMQRSAISTEAMYLRMARVFD